MLSMQLGDAMLYYAIPPQNHFFDFVSKYSHFLTITPAWKRFDDINHPMGKSSFIHQTEVIIDNGTFEYGKPDDLQHQIGVARKFDYHGAHIIFVLPDVWKDADGTLNAVKKSWKLVQNGLGVEGYRFMMVPQGERIGDWVYCYERLMDWADLIGIEPIVGISKHQFELGARKILIDEEIRGERPVHLLGADSMSELMELKGKVRSVDTAMPIKMALAGQKVFPNTVTPKKLKLDFQGKLTDAQLELAIANTKRMAVLLE